MGHGGLMIGNLFELMIGDVFGPRSFVGAVAQVTCMRGCGAAYLCFEIREERFVLAVHDELQSELSAATHPRSQDFAISVVCRRQQYCACSRSSRITTGRDVLAVDPHHPSNLRVALSRNNQRAPRARAGTVLALI